MNSIRVLLCTGFARILRYRIALLLTVTVPVAMIYIFGWVFGLYGKHGRAGIPLAVVNRSDHPAAQKLIEALQAEKAFHVITDFANADGSLRLLGETDARSMIRGREARFALVIPPDMIPPPGVGLHLKILANPVNEIETQLVTGLLQKTIVRSLPRLVTASWSPVVRQRLALIARAVDRALDPYPPEAPQSDGPIRVVDDGEWYSRFMRIETEQLVGERVKNPLATRIVGGWAFMFLMFELNATATSLFDERKNGIFRRLLAGPVTRAEILWSRFLFGVVLGLVQLVAVFCAGGVLYGIDVLAHAGNLIIVSVVAAAACTALGLVVASFSDTPQSAMALATLIIVTMSAIGGAWFPISLMPAFIQQLAKYTLTYWAVDGFTQVFWAGNPLWQIVPTLGVLLAATGAMMAIAIWRFNRRRLFD